MRSAGGARFPLEAAKRLGTDGLREAMRLLADAELDLRGYGGLDERTVIDVLVARLAALTRRHQPRRARARPGADGALTSSELRSARRFISRDVRRAAWFLWMMPLAPALSSRFCAARTCSSASSAPAATPSWATFTRVFSSERTPLLRRRRFSFCRLRFF